MELGDHAGSDDGESDGRVAHKRWRGYPEFASGKVLKERGELQYF
jgi:hypothetical protein